MKATRQNKNIRLFVSSTFEDMKIERKILQEHIFPALKIYCQDKGWQFEAVDLRWGISQEANSNQQTMRICLSELKRCQQISPRPNFLILLGQRYGWKPLPETIPLKSKIDIHNIASPDERDLFLDWYLIDKNALPKGEFVLQPRNSPYDEYVESVEKPLRKLFKRYAETLNSNYEKLIYERSATEQEIYAGAMAVEDANEHVIAYFRNITNIPENKSVSFLDHNSESEHLLKNLKNEIYDKLGDHNIINNNLAYEEYNSEEYKNKFYNAIFGQIKDIIDKEIEAEVEISVKEEQLIFADERISEFQGREAEICEIENHVFSGSKQPMVITGESGCGKTTLLAKVHANLRKNNDINVISRYIGTGISSSNGSDVLNSLMNEIFDLYYDAEAIKKLQETNDISERFKRILSDLSSPPRTNRKPLVVIIDALDQLPEYDILLDLKWLSFIFSKQCRLIISTLEGSVLRNLSKRGATLLTLDGLKKKDAIKLFVRNLVNYQRGLSEDQFSIIKEAMGENNISPLYLKFAVEYAKNLHSYDEIDNFPSTVEDLISKTLDQMSMPENHGVLVAKIFSMLKCAKRGLSNDEILELLGLDNDYVHFLRQTSMHELPVINGEISIPPILWSRLYNDFSPYLVNKSAPGGMAVVTFYHRKVWEIVEKKYLQGQRIKNDIYRKTADYFLLQQNHKTIRFYDELPFCLSESNQLDELLKLLFDLEYIQKKITYGLYDDLVQEYSAALYIADSKQDKCAKENIKDFSTKQTIDVEGELIDLTDYTLIKERLKDVRDFIIQELQYTAIAQKYEDYVLNKAANYRSNSFILKMFKKYDIYKGYLINKLQQEHIPSENSNPVTISFNIGRNPILSHDALKVIFIKDDEDYIAVHHLDYNIEKKSFFKGEKVLLFDITPDWKWLAVVTTTRIILFDMQKEYITQYIEFDKKTDFVSISSNGNKILFGGDQFVSLFDAENKKAFSFQHDNSKHLYGKITEDGCFAFFTTDQQILKYDFENNRVCRSIHLPKTLEDEKVLAFDISANGDVVTYSLAKKLYVIFNDGKGFYIQKDSEESGVQKDYPFAKLNKDGTKLLYADYQFMLWDVVNGKQLTEFSTFGQNTRICNTSDFKYSLIQNMSYSNISILSDNILSTELYDLEKLLKNNQEEFSTLRYSDTSRLNNISVLPNGNIVIASYGWGSELCMNSCITIFRKENNIYKKKRHELKSLSYEMQHYISSNDISQNGQLLIYSILCRTYIKELKNIDDKEKTICLGESNGTVLVSHFTQDQKCVYSFTGHLISTPEYSEGMLWNIKTGELIRKYVTPENLIQQLYQISAFPGGKSVLMHFVYPVSYMILDLETGRLSEIIDSPVITIMPDGHSIIYRDQTSRCNTIMDIYTGKTFQLDQNEHAILAVSPDYKIKCYKTTDNNLQIITSKDSYLVKFSGLESCVFTYDAKHLFIEFEHGILLWNCVERKEIGRFYTDIMQLGIKKIYNKGIVLGGQTPLTMNMSTLVCLLEPFQYEINKEVVVTLTQIWDLTEQTYQTASVDCPICGNRFQPSEKIKKVIDEYIKTFINDMNIPAYMQFPAEVWNDPNLIGNCPECKASLRYNPFIAH